jgi:hypothetical protein
MNLLTSSLADSAKDSTKDTSVIDSTKETASNLAQSASETASNAANSASDTIVGTCKIALLPLIFSLKSLEVLQYLNYSSNIFSSPLCQGFRQGHCEVHLESPSTFNRSDHSCGKRLQHDKFSYGMVKLVSRGYPLCFLLVRSGMGA